MTTDSIFTNLHIYNPERQQKVASLDAVLSELTPIRFSMDNLRMEKLPIPERKWFRFDMLNPAMPSFCTFQKTYFGNVDQVKKIMHKRADLQPDLIPCKPLAMACIEFPRTAWKQCITPRLCKSWGLY